MTLRARGILNLRRVLALIVLSQNQMTSLLRRWMSQQTKLSSTWFQRVGTSH